MASLAFWASWTCSSFIGLSFSHWLGPWPTLDFSRRSYFLLGPSTSSTELLSSGPFQFVPSWILSCAVLLPPFSKKEGRIHLFFFEEGKSHKTFSGPLSPEKNPLRRSHGVDGPGETPPPSLSSLPNSHHGETRSWWYSPAKKVHWYTRITKDTSLFLPSYPTPPLECDRSINTSHKAATARLSFWLSFAFDSLLPLVWGRFFLWSPCCCLSQPYHWELLSFGPRVVHKFCSSSSFFQPRRARVRLSLLLTSGDIEPNPGPPTENYKLHPYLFDLALRSLEGPLPNLDAFASSENA